MSNTAPQHIGFRWDAEWRVGLFALVFIPLFVALGVWQLQRAEEKQAITARWEAQMRLPPVPVQTLVNPSPDQAYRPVSVAGRPLAGRDFLLDNRIREGRYGVEVISPVSTASGRLVLVNRGWLEADPTRRSLPEVPPLSAEAELKGYLYVPPGESYILGEIASDNRWPRLVQAADVASLGDMLGDAVYPYIVRLSADSAGAFLAEWPLVNTRPEKHRAYAFQWFAMAAALLLLFLWRSSNIGELIQRRNTRKESEY